MKKPFQVYLEPEDYARLKAKAKELYSGRGSISRFIEKIAKEQIVFLDDNVKNVMSLFQHPKLK